MAEAIRQIANYGLRSNSAASAPQRAKKIIPRREAEDAGKDNFVVISILYQLNNQ